MKSTAKLATISTIKFFLIISLLVSAAFAEDGHMPGGNLTGDGNTKVVCETVEDDGHMPGGNIVCREVEDDGHMPGGNRATSADNGNSDDSILGFVRNYLFSLFR